MAIATIGALFVAAVPGTGALYFSSSALRATDTQIQVAEQGQITDRWNAAVTNLGSANIEIRLGGIYALQRIMQDSPRDQSTVVAVLCAFVRDHTSSGAAPPGASASHLATDIQAALNVVGTRNIAHDDGAIVDLNDAQLHKAQLSSMVFYDADFSGADLSSAYLASTKFLGANLSGANFSGTDLTEADLSSADLSGTDLSGAQISGANLFDADPHRRKSHWRDHQQ
jgi:hypothetical protein